MAELQYHTAGESHGPALTALIDGMPADVAVDLARINAELLRRQGGHGRSTRQKIERDEVQVMAGVRHGRTTGAPVVLQILNRDSRLETAPPMHAPRPGHADLAGCLKWLTVDARNTVERASARETAARVAVGALTRCLLDPFGVEVVGYVTRIGPCAATIDESLAPSEIAQRRDASDVYCPDATATAAMIAAIDEAGSAGDTLGGVVEVRVHGLCPGLGSCARAADKLDGRLMAALGTVQAVKGVEIGLGFESAARPGSNAHDAIEYDPDQVDRANVGFVRPTNHAGGIEGGMTNGAPLIVRAALKPISTLMRGMPSVDLRTRQSTQANVERSDVCAIPAASVIAENAIAFEIARAFLQKFGGDTLFEVRTAYDRYLDAIRSLGSAD